MGEGWLRSVEEGMVCECGGGDGRGVWGKGWSRSVGEGMVKEYRDGWYRDMGEGGAGACGGGAVHPIG